MRTTPSDLGLALLGGLLQYAYAILIGLALLAATGLAFLPLPALPTPLAQYVPPDMVQVPVPRVAIASGEKIDNVVDATEMAYFPRAQVAGKITQRDALQRTISKAVLVRGQPISADDVEPYVVLPFTKTPLETGDVIAFSDINFEMRPLPRSSLNGSEVSDWRVLDQKLVVSPIGAGEPVPRSSVADFVMMPVLQKALAAGRLISDSNVLEKPVSVDSLGGQIANFEISKDELVSSPHYAGRNVAPNAPIQRDWLSGVPGSQ